MTLQLGYIVLTIATVIFLTLIGFKAIDRSYASEIGKRKKMTLVTGLILWHLYIYLVTSSGFITNLDFPPRFALMMIVPSFIFTGVFISRNSQKGWLINIPPSTLFFFQSFRILVELLFAGSVAVGVLHKEASIHGYNFDMIYVATIPIVGLLAFRSKSQNLKLVRLWNYLGLLVIASIIFVFMTTIYAPQLYGYEDPMLPLEALTYPYVLVAGFLMPVAVFVHVLSIAQLNRLISG